MKASFWVAPEGADGALTLQPVESISPRPTGGIGFLATREGAEIAARCPQTAALLPVLASALHNQQPHAPGALFDITDWPAEETTLLSQMLGEGEVTGLAALPGGVVAQIEETTLAGLWRVRFTGDDGRLTADYLEVAAIPHIVRRAAELGAESLEIGAPPEGVMNAMPVLAEIADQMRNLQPGAPPHVVNFTLMPVSDVDMAFLQKTLGQGAVQLVSRGYGACRISATGARHVWAVQYFNAADAVLLDTLEIGDIPAAALAAREDFEDSAQRLVEIHEAYFA